VKKKLAVLNFIHLLLPSAFPKVYSGKYVQYTSCNLPTKDHRLQQN